jgi:tetraacyldisaccharide 4'-kinase
MAAHAERPLGKMAAPLAWAFGAAAHARRFVYDRGLAKSADPGVLTISVGGLEAGGSGKTPIAGWLLAACRELGLEPGLLTRGYGRRSRGLCVAKVGEASVARVGDEPTMLARELGVPVAAVAKRLIGAKALRELGCTAIVLDDGFSHRAIARDLDVVVLRAEAPLGNGQLLPAGTLRESPAGLVRADIVWTHARSGERDEQAVVKAMMFASRALRVDSEDGHVVVHDTRGTVIDLDGAPVIAACGIARPGAFEATLRRAGADVLGLVGFPDHVRYTDHDVDELARRVVSSGARALVVTAKDAVKLDAGKLGVPLWVARVSIKITRGEEALRERLNALAVRRPDAARLARGDRSA